MIKEYLLLLFFCVTSHQFVYTQSSPIFKQFVQQKDANGTLPFPDFSYAGYHHGLDNDYVNKGQSFVVTDFGAIPDDEISDMDAIQKTINAAIENGGGIVVFPKGKFLVNTKDDSGKNLTFNLANTRITIQGNEGTEIEMKNHLTPAIPGKLWTTPYLFKFKGVKKKKLITRIIGNSKMGSKLIEVEDTKLIKANDWILLSLHDNNPELVEKEKKGQEFEKEWTYVIDGGVEVKALHQVAMVMGNTIVLKEPLLKDVESRYQWEVYTSNNNQEFLMKNIAFTGNWTTEFVHHENALHDGGYSILALSNLTNFRLQNCHFKNVSRAVTVGHCANGSITENVISGNRGHSGISVNNSTRIFVGKNKDQAGQWHTFGVTKASIGNVFWRNENAPNSSFESHASQPRATLIDCAKGGFIFGRLGGARHNLPNHMENLVLWNYNETDAPDKDYEFWSSESWWGKVIPPIIVGFHGSGTTFKEDQIKVLESLGKPVSPGSLYEAQLLLRLGALPKWALELKN